MQDNYQCPVEDYQLVSAEASNEQISELIGMSFPIFTNTILFAQNSRGRSVTDFLDEDDAGKKEIFSTLFNLQGYEQALELIKPDLKTARERHEALIKSQETAELELDHNNKTLDSLLVSKKEFQSKKEQSIRALKEELDTINFTLTTRNVDYKEKELTILIESTKNQEQKLKETKEKEEAAKEPLLILKTSITNKAGELERKKSFGILVPEKPTKPTGNLDDLQKEKADLEKLLPEARALKQKRDQDKDSYTARFTKASMELVKASDASARAKHEQREIDQERNKLQSTIDTLRTCPTCFQPFANKEAKELAVSEILGRLNKLKDVDLSFFYEHENKAKCELQEVEKTKWDNIEDIELKEKVTKLDQDVQTANFRIARWQEYLQDLAKYEGIVENLDTLKKQRSEEIRALEQEIITGYDKCKEMEQEFQALVEERQRNERAVKELEEMRDNVRIYIESNILPLQQRAIIVRDNLVTEKMKSFPEDAWLCKAQEESNQLNERILGLRETSKETKKEVEVLEHLYEAFGKEGIIAELFREYIPSIQQKASEYLSELTNNELQIEFKAEKQLKKKVEGVSATRAQFAIEVSKQNGGTGYDLISGSEQNKAALVANWALSDLAYLHSNVSCNLRCYDEVFDGLDALSSERLAQCLIRRAQESDQIMFVVTHKQELDEVFEHKIVLEKQNGVTSICLPEQQSLVP